MLGTPKALGQAIEGEAVSRSKSPRAEGTGAGNGLGGKGKRIYGRLARSDEHPASVAVLGRESGQALQVRRRAEDSRIQVGQPLALQEIAFGSVDGREVERDGTAGETESEGGIESCRTK